MRWMVRLAKEGYLPRAEDEEAFRAQLPVLMWRGATFKTRREAEAALAAARTRGLPITEATFEKVFPKSSPFHGETSANGLTWKDTGETFPTRAAAARWMDFRVPPNDIRRGWRVGLLGMSEGGMFFRVTKYGKQAR